MELLDMLLKGLGANQQQTRQDYSNAQDQLRQQQQYQDLMNQQQQQQQSYNAGSQGLDINQLARQLNLNPSQVQDVLQMALPLILGKLGQNTQTDEGANSLSRALENHANRQYNTPQDINEEDGKGILGHIFGNRGTNEVSKEIGNKAGLDSGSSMRILTMLAPLALAYLARQKKDNNLDERGVRDLTNRYSNEMNQRAGGSLFDALQNLPDDNRQDQQSSGGLLGGLLGSLLGR